MAGSSLPTSATASRRLSALNAMVATYGLGDSTGSPSLVPVVTSHRSDRTRLIGIVAETVIRGEQAAVGTEGDGWRLWVVDDPDLFAHGRAGGRVPTAEHATDDGRDVLVVAREGHLRLVDLTAAVQDPDEARAELERRHEAARRLRGGLGAVGGDGEQHRPVEIALPLLEGVGGELTGQRRDRASASASASLGLRLGALFVGELLGGERPLLLPPGRSRAADGSPHRETGDEEETDGERSDQGPDVPPARRPRPVERRPAGRGDLGERGVDPELGGVGAPEPALGLRQLDLVEQPALSSSEPHPLRRLGFQLAAGLLGLASLGEPAPQRRPAADQCLMGEVDAPVGAILAAGRRQHPVVDEVGHGRVELGRVVARRAQVAHPLLPAGVGTALAELDESHEDPPGDRLPVRRELQPRSCRPPRHRRLEAASRAVAGPSPPAIDSYASSGRNRRASPSHESTNASWTSGSTPGSPAASATSRSTREGSTCTPAPSAGWTIAVPQTGLAERRHLHPVGADLAPQRRGHQIGVEVGPGRHDHPAPFRSGELGELFLEWSPPARGRR